MKHYILCPGYVISQTDGDKHYISWQQLQHLYRLNKVEFSVQRGIRSMHGTPIFDPVPPTDRELIYLHPRKDGRYGRPE